MSVFRNFLKNENKFPAEKIDNEIVEDHFANNDRKSVHISEVIITEDVCVEEHISVEPCESVTEKVCDSDTNTKEQEEIEDGDDLLDHSIGIENIICEEDENWNNGKDEQVQAAILAAAWDAVECNSETLLAEVDLDRVRS